ncbi:hypothetical protein BpHYR1_015060 [Brachionus plicatilis]|uniref:Uncharacterized protein n=1 Tax=Brachionus plicatilis TaxID=10195 RepID=A0A3M7SN90_BRAPC|nr:hypothetical protein BpHYR1_015060 [Brachionus plicatilis]
MTFVRLNLRSSEPCEAEREREEHKTIKPLERKPFDSWGEKMSQLNSWSKSSYFRQLRRCAPGGQGDAETDFGMIKITIIEIWFKENNLLKKIKIIDTSASLENSSAMMTFKSNLLDKKKRKIFRAVLNGSIFFSVVMITILNFALSLVESESNGMILSFIFDSSMMCSQLNNILTCLIAQRSHYYF